MSSCSSFQTHLGGTTTVRSFQPLCFCMSCPFAWSVPASRTLYFSWRSSDLTPAEAFPGAPLLPPALLPALARLSSALRILALWQPCTTTLITPARFLECEQPEGRNCMFSECVSCSLAQCTSTVQSMYTE